VEEENKDNPHSLFVDSHQAVLLNAMTGQDLSVRFVVTKHGGKPPGSRARVTEVTWAFCLSGWCRTGDRVGTKIVGAITSPQCFALLAFHVCLSRRGFEGIKTFLIKGRGWDINGIGG